MDEAEQVLGSRNYLKYFFMSLLEECGTVSEDEEIPPTDQGKPKANLQIRSTSMTQFRKYKCMSVFLDLVEDDLSKLHWQAELPDNLSLEERKALCEYRWLRSLSSRRVKREGMWYCYPKT